MNIMPKMADNSVDFTLTDIPYNEVNRADNGRNGFGVELNDNYYSIASERLSPFLKENTVYSLIAQIVRKKQHLNGGQNG